MKNLVIATYVAACIALPFIACAQPGGKVPVASGHYLAPNSYANANPPGTAGKTTAADVRLVVGSTLRDHGVHAALVP